MNDIKAHDRPKTCRSTLSRSTKELNGDVMRKLSQQKKIRRSVPPPLAAEILYMSNRTCCVCTDPGKPIQIHHIDEDPSNNSLENLAVLCLHCHEYTQISGGFGRKLDAAQVSKFREQWLIRVNLRRNKADENSIKSVNQKDHASQPAIPLRDYIPMLPEFLARAYNNAREGWAGTTADMLNASYYVADVLEGMLAYLTNFYPNGHFDQRDPRDYISEVVSTRYSWHRHHMEPSGGGSGGTMIGPMVAMNVITDLRVMVNDMVSSLSDDPRNHYKFDFLQWRSKWRSATGEAKEISVENAKLPSLESTEPFYEKPSYWVEKKGVKDGPFCQRCYDSERKLIRLQDGKRDRWECHECKNVYFGPSYIPFDHTELCLPEW